MVSAETKVRLVIIEPLAVFFIATHPVATYEPQAPTNACAAVKGFMIEDMDGMVSKDASTPTYVLVEVSERHAPTIARALTNAINVYLMPLRDCNLGS